MIRVLAIGCFDGLHPGHIAHLKAAANAGNWLTVALTVDEEVKKGPGRPCFTWNERALMLEELRCVDLVVPHFGNSERSLMDYKPEIYVKGVEYVGKLKEQEFAESMGIKVLFLDTYPVYSSSAMLKGDLLRDRIARESRNKESLVRR